jgi:5-methylcytosine-specific restriction enzyme subunit McrC
MNIPIRNLYYLFVYAWAQFPGGRFVETGVDDSPDLPNLFAAILSTGVRTLLRRGLDRGYQTLTEELIGPRGRLRLDRMIAEATLLRGTAVCDYDELTHNVLHNQILKATLLSLSRCADVRRDTRHDLRSLSRHFQEVSTIRLGASHFRLVALHRNNSEYDFLMRLCEFVYRSLLPDVQGTGSRFQSILEDEMRMSKVFETFLRNFFRAHLSEYRVRAEQLDWDVAEATEADLTLLPRMLTDITLRSADRTIIVDAKFYKDALAEGPFGKRVRSQHLYQLVTYLQHERMRHSGGHDLSGMLIYPAVGGSLRLRYRLLGTPVLVATVDLSQEWQCVGLELRQLFEAPEN